jgi:hypothetical protein
MGVAIPKRQTWVRSFLGLCTNYWRFVAGSADSIKLLNQLVVNKLATQCSSDAEAAFLSLKESMSVAIILGYSWPQAAWELVYSTRGLEECSGLLQEDSIQGWKELTAWPSRNLRLLWWC